MNPEAPLSQEEFNEIVDRCVDDSEAGQQLKHSYQQQGARWQAAVRDYEDLNRDFHEYQEGGDQLEIEMSKCLEENETLSSQVSKLQEELNASRDKLQRLSKSASSASSEHERVVGELQEERDTLRQRVMSLEQDVDSLERKLRIAQAKCEDVENELETQVAHLVLTQSELEDTKSKSSVEMQNLREVLNEATAELSMLRSSFSSSLSVLGTEQRVDVPPRDTENLGVPSSRAGEETVVAEEGEGEGMTELEHVLFLLEQESDKEVLRDVLDAVLAQIRQFKDEDVVHTLESVIDMLEDRFIIFRADKWRKQPDTGASVGMDGDTVLSPSSPTSSPGARHRHNRSRNFSTANSFPLLQILPAGSRKPTRDTSMDAVSRAAAILADLDSMLGNCQKTMQNLISTSSGPHVATQ